MAHSLKKRRDAAGRTGWWNHRVVVMLDVDGCGTNDVSIREVHYECIAPHDIGEEACPAPKTHKTGWSNSPSEPYGETIDELRADLVLFKRALLRPPLYIDRNNRLVPAPKPAARKAKKK